MASTQLLEETKFDQNFKNVHLQKSNSSGSISGGSQGNDGREQDLNQMFKINLYANQRQTFKEKRRWSGLVFIDDEHGSQQSPTLPEQGLKL